jgi:hypothetical protein
MVELPPEPTSTIAIGSISPSDSGVTELDALEAGDVPVLLDAVTVKVYEVPFVKPEIVIGDAPVPVRDPGEEVAVNVVAVPPVAAAV